MSLCCALFLCRTNPHIHEQGGDSAPTFYSSSKLRKSHFFTASPPLEGFGHFCPIAFLSTPAAHRSVQSWTHLPKIGEVCFLGQSNFGLSFPLSFVLRGFSQKSKKPPGLSKLNYQFCPKMCAILRISAAQPFAQFCVIVFFWLVLSQIPRLYGKGSVLSLPKSEKQNLSSVFGG